MIRVAAERSCYPRLPLEPRRRPAYMPMRSCVLVLLSLCALAASNAALGDTVSGADGVDIAYREHGKGDITLIFVHGWSCDRGYWREQPDFFAAGGDSGYRVVLLDLGGHGESGSDRDDWSMAAFGADVAAVADAVGGDRLVLIGHSMGGPVVIEAAKILRERVELIVAVDTLQEPGATGYGEEESRQLWAPFAADYATSIDGFVRSNFFLPDASPELVDRVASDMASADAAIALEAGHELTTWSPRDGIGSVRDIPFVLLNADYRPTDREALLQVHPQARLETMSGAGHFPMLEMPRVFNERLADILDSTLE